ncbi:PmeII family type II restriction endonuclease [Brevibacillus marinus]|uniref:PmeII family type II restriction endonuclease n=1 Tax=Brevibacillus marinus TaxID=2496837 RepID=UPI001F4964EC|nr:PmeII family type II restriction endonuclease [Brevibacillus marinus]
MTDLELEKLVDQALHAFYTRRIEGLESLELKDILKRKNPYLYRAIGVETGDQLLTELLQAHVSSSDEGIFGEIFFEMLAEKASGGHIRPARGVDVGIETDSCYKAIAVKSSPNIFNSQSRGQQQRDFDEMMRTWRNKKTGKEFIPIVGYGYGDKRQSERNKNTFKEISGQEFWEELTNDPEFYRRIIKMMEGKTAKYAKKYQQAFQDAVTRFRDKLNEFCFSDGKINWDKLVHFNSGKQIKSLKVYPKSKSLRPGESLQLMVQATLFETEGSPAGKTVDMTDSPEITYVVSEPEFVTVNSHGLVTIDPGASPGHQAKVTAIYKNKTATFNLKVAKSRRRK